MNTEEQVFGKFQKVAESIQEGIEKFCGFLNYSIRVFAVLASFYIFAVLIDRGHSTVAPVFLCLFLLSLWYFRRNNNGSVTG